MYGFKIRNHGGPEVLMWEEISRMSPGPAEVLVRVKACALNHLDLWVRNGVDGHRFPLPLIPGSEISGTIEEVGMEVHDFAVGDSVLIAPGVSCGTCDRCLNDEDMLCRHFGVLGETRDGGYAEFVKVPHRNVLPHPSKLSFVESAALPLTFLTAWHMLNARAQLQSSEDVLIHAAGSGVSSAAIQIAKYLGAQKIIVTASNSRKLASASKLGATHTANYRSGDFAEEVRRIVGKKGVEVVVDHVGGDTFEKSIDLLGWGGRLVLCGATSNPMAKINLKPIFFKSLSILGSTMGGLKELRQILRLVESGIMKPVVDRTFPLSRARQAQEYLEQRKQFGKVVLIADDSDSTKALPTARA